MSAQETDEVLASPPVKGVFRSLSNYNYRLWTAGAAVSNIGTWMQRIAQDWLVLTQLTHHDATAVGIVTGLQFVPRILLLPWTGVAADHFDRRKLLIATQIAMGLLALALGLLTITGLVRLPYVYVFSFLLGCATAFDAPARQTFVADMVGEADLTNAVALNSTSFNAARMIGPAIAGIMIALVGTGWVLLINAVSFAAVIGSLLVMRRDELHPRAPAQGQRGRFLASVRYVLGRPDLTAIMLMLFVIGALGINFPIFISTMSVTVFKVDADGFGLLTSAMAIGSVTGAFLTAHRERPDIALLVFAAALFGGGCVLAAMMPNYILFGLVLIVIGVSVQTFTASSTGLVQMSTEPALRGRVMAIMVTMALAGQPIGAPFVGWVADAYGPPVALIVGGSSGILAAIIGLHYYIRHRGFRARIESGGLRFDIDGARRNERTETK